VISRRLTPERRGRRFITGIATFGLIAGTLLASGTALAVHDLQFQLDGDTTATAYSPPTGANPPYDWNSVFTVTTGATTQTVSNNSALVGSGKTFDAASFVRDFETNATCPTTSAVGLNSTSLNLCTADDTTYATGSKDTLGVGNGGWQCNHDNNVNSKIDIMNAYVLQYTDTSFNPPHKVFYFGVERNVSNGTNDVGVWFLQNGASCTAPTGHTNFTGGHQDGDTLVVAEQTSGGGVSTAKAFRWAAAASGPLSGDGGCIDSNDNPDPSSKPVAGCNNLPIATGADCKTTGGTDALCATTNAFCPPPRHGTTTPPCTLPWNADVTTPWMTANGSTVGNTIVSPDFFEGGIDITRAFSGHPGTAPSCFTTTVPDTRSSASPTATLFDFTLNQFGGCGGSLSTQENAATPRAIAANGTISSGTDTATLQITGSGVWNGDLTWYLCGPNVTTCNSAGYTDATLTTAVHSTDGGTAADAVKTYTSGTATLTAAGVGAAGQYCWHAHFQPDAASLAAGIDPQDDNGDNECFRVTPLTPTLTTTASCLDSLGNPASPCIVGSTLSDTASLTGTARNPDPLNPGTNSTYPTINGGTKAADSTINWTLYGPGTGGVAQCSTTITGAPTPSSVDVSGDNTAYGPVTYVSTAVGKYEFAATYGGDGPNTLAATAVGCDTTGANNEQVTVIGSATSSSAQRWLPNDRVVLGSTAGTTLHGTLTVTLYKGVFGGTADNCTVGTGVATGVSSGAVAVSTATNSFIYNTTNTTFFVGTNPDGTTTGAGTAGTYFWLIHYDDNSLTDPSDRCETSTLSPITD